MRLARCSMVLVISLVLVACGITAPARNAGYADFDSLGFRDVDQTMTLSFGPMILKLAAMGMDDDPETRSLVMNLDGVRVKTYDVVGDAERVGTRIDMMSDRLQAQGWVPVVRVREQRERSVVLVRIDEEQIVGIAVINSDGLEAVLVNVMGNLRPELLSKAMKELDVDVPDIGPADHLVKL